ncbi:MAG: phage portal protein, partial [Candidatus Didemnitutus sp.]|nr:phage portal protein [Candidatus Didemnitutus sp.]
MSAQIVNQFGRPYDSPARYSGTEEDRRFMNRPKLDGDMATLLSRSKHKMILNDARWIRESFPLVGGAVEQKADYVSAAGWLPEFFGNDRDWGELVTEKLHLALNIADVRGQLFDWTDLFWTASSSLDVDGSVFPLLTETASGFPQTQFLEAHRIGQRSPGRLVGTQDAYTLIPRAPGQPPEKVWGIFFGRKIINGIIYNEACAEIGYRVLGENSTEDRDIFARDMVHITHPRWFSDGRPFPSIAYAALDWYDVKEARELQRTQQKVHAALTLIESNESGAPPPVPKLGEGPIRAGADAATEPQTQLLMGGLVRYVRSAGGKLDSHESNSPSDGWRAFDRTIIAGALFGMGWRAEMLDLSLLGGAGVRGFQDNINTVILGRHRRISRYALRIVKYFVSKLIRRGDITPNAEWWKWFIPQPPEFNVDASRAMQQDRDNIRFGLDSHPDAVRRSL